MGDVKENIIHVTQGQFEVSNRAEDIMTTVLGSCVAACLHDPVAKVGGMNHFLLPGADPDARSNVKYGAHSMEQLINAMLRAGASRSRIEAHIFGGGNVVKGLSRIGDSNRVFALDFIRSEGFTLKSNDSGGTSGRRVKFSPTTGQSAVRRLDAGTADVQSTEKATPVRKQETGNIELF